MKNIIHLVCYLALILSCLPVNAQNTVLTHVDAFKSDYLIAGDDFVPIPWGKELPISWLKLPGTWIVKQAQQKNPNYFTFQILNQNGTNKILYIQQIDPKSCKVIGTGVANQFDKKVIYATLRNLETKQVYRVNLRSFSASAFNPSNALPTYEGQVMLISLAFINSYKFVHYPLSKVNFSTAGVNCREQLVK